MDRGKMFYFQKLMLVGLKHLSDFFIDETNVENNSANGRAVLLEFYVV